MKKTVIILSILTLILGACKQEVKLWPTMTMITYRLDVRISLLGTGTAIVNWGDRTPDDMVMISKKRSEDFYHTYVDTASHTITVTGDNVTYWGCFQNQLISLDVSKNTALERLLCEDNQLTSLDVSNNTKLTELNCSGNQLTSLDVSKNTKLTDLYCDHNRLTSLDVSNNQALALLTIHSNKFDVAALNAVFGTLHSQVVWWDGDIIDGERTKKMDIGNNPGTETCNRNIAADKGWRVSALNPYLDWSKF